MDERSSMARAMTDEQRQMLRKRAEPRFCIDCRYFESDGSLAPSPVYDHRCMRPHLSLVDGKEHPLNADAEDQRRAHGYSPEFVYCGPSAQFFQPKEQS